MIQSGAAGSNTVRLFIGIACPPLTRIVAFLKELQIVALNGDSGIRVVDGDNLHITLKFLGPVASSFIGDVAGALDQIGADTKPFTITLAGTGIFKDAFWLGLRPCKHLHELALLINQRLEPFGFAPENRPFIPHLTVARINQRSRVDTEPLLQQFRDEVWASLEVQQIHLYQSVTLPTGVKYSVMHTAKLL